MSDPTKSDVVAKAKHVAGLALANKRRFDYSRTHVRGWLIRDVKDRRYQAGDLHVDRLGNDWKDLHSKVGQLWLGEDGTLYGADEIYGESAEVGNFDHSKLYKATNEDLIGAGNLDYGQIMKELRRLELIVE